MMLSRFLPEGEHFTFDELLFLEILMYTSEETPFKNILDMEGKTVRELVDGIDEDLLVDDKIYRGYLSGMEWKKILNVMKNRDRLLDIVIADTYMDEDFGGGGGLAALMLSKKNHEAVVAFRGTATREWVDDFAGANRADTLQQLNALEWYHAIYRKHHMDQYYVTLVGHSKGGNKAKYITILDDTPDRCYSIDGQGFSDAFFAAYGERILLRQDRIENHSIDYDSINALMTEIGKEYFYTGYDYGQLGYIETHSLGKFFHWDNDGGYMFHPNSKGQSTEILALKHFFNSYIRSIPTEEDQNEMIHCLGLIVQKSNEIKDEKKEEEERILRAKLDGKEVEVIAKEKSEPAFIGFVCNLIANPVYTDKVAFLVAFLICYQRLHPNFIEELKGIPEQFGMSEMKKVASYLESILNWKELNRAMTVTGFLSEHLPKGIVHQLQIRLNKSLNLDLNREELESLLSIVARVRQYVSGMIICENPPEELIRAGYMKPEVSTEAVISRGVLEERDSTEKEEVLDILVLAGGLSAERNISLRSGYRITDTLRKMGHRVLFLDSFMGCSADEELLADPFAHAEEMSSQPFASADAMPDLWAVQKRRSGNDPAIIGPNVLQLCRKADLVFVGLHNARGEYGKLQGALELCGIRYTGDRYEASVLSMNKDLSKKLAAYSGVETADWAVVVKKDRGMEETELILPEEDTEESRECLPKNLTFPVIVKPCCGGSGIGVSLAWNQSSYQNALTEAFRWESKVLVEEFLPGREFSVSILEGRVLPPAEICLPSGIYDYQARFLLKKAYFRCPVPETEINRELCEKAEMIAKLFQIEEYCRVDFRMTEDGRLMFLECDTLPDLTEEGLLEKTMEAAGISFEELCRSIINRTRKKTLNIE